MIDTEYGIAVVLSALNSADKINLRNYMRFVLQAAKCYDVITEYQDLDNGFVEMAVKFKKVATT